MNAAGKKELGKAVGLLDEAQAIIDKLRETEQETYDDLSEGQQEGEKGESMMMSIEAMESVVDDIAGVIENLGAL